MADEALDDGSWFARARGGGGGACGGTLRAAVSLRGREGEMVWTQKIQHLIKANKYTSFLLLSFSEGGHYGSEHQWLPSLKHRGKGGHYGSEHQWLPSLKHRGEGGPSLKHRGEGGHYGSERCPWYEGSPRDRGRRAGCCGCRGASLGVGAKWRGCSGLWRGACDRQGLPWRPGGSAG